MDKKVKKVYKKYWQFTKSRLQLHYRKRGDTVLAKITFKAARISAGYTQETLAEKMGVTRQTVINWENGSSLIGTSQLFMFCRLTKFKGEDILLPKKSIKSGRKQKK